MISINHVFVELEKPLQDEILLGNGLKLYLDPSYTPEWHATVSGTVTSIPQNPKGEHRDIAKSISIGDEVAFSYSVVSDMSFANNQDSFYELTEGSPYFQKFINAKGEMITVIAMKGAISKLWVGTYVSRSHELISGVQGSEAEKDRWLAQFSFGDNQKMKFNNLLDIDGKDYWKAKLDDVFAKKTGDEVVAISDKVICEPIDVDLTQQVNISEGIVLPESSIQARLYDRATLVSGGEDKGLKKGDVVSFDPQYVEKYNLWGKEYFLIKKHRVNGTWN